MERLLFIHSHLKSLGLFSDEKYFRNFCGGDAPELLMKLLRIHSELIHVPEECQAALRRDAAHGAQSSLCRFRAGVIGRIPKNAVILPDKNAPTSGWREKAPQFFLRFQ